MSKSSNKTWLRVWPQRAGQKEVESAPAAVVPDRVEPVSAAGASKRPDADERDFWIEVGRPAPGETASAASGDERVEPKAPQIPEMSPPRQADQAKAAPSPRSTRDAVARPGSTNRQPADQDEPVLPKFRFMASDMSLASADRATSSTAAGLAELREAFTPTQPKRAARLFAGRRKELERIVAAIDEWKAHVVIYGERGYGKSSLANVVVEIAREGGITVLNSSCTSETRFEEVFRGYLRELPLPYRGIAPNQLKSPQEKSLAALLPPGNFGAKELTDALRYLTDTPVIFRIDEFDRVTDEHLKEQLAEAIKSLSDLSADITFLIVGVAEDLDDLLGKHPSIQRNVVAVHLTLMTEDELRQLLLAGERAGRVRFDGYVRERIIALSRGLPYQAQLLALHAGQAAVKRNSESVERVDLAEAVSRVAQIAPPAVERAYQRTLASEDRAVDRAIAYAAALCACDLYGYFSASDIVDVGSKAGITLPDGELIRQRLSDMSRENGGIVFKTRIDGGDVSFSFIDPIMRPYILAREAHTRGLI